MAARSAWEALRPALHGKPCDLHAHIVLSILWHMALHVHIRRALSCTFIISMDCWALFYVIILRRMSTSFMHATRPCTPTHSDRAGPCPLPPTPLQVLDRDWLPTKLSKMSVKELRAELSARKHPVYGNKAELAKRLTVCVHGRGRGKGEEGEGQGKFLRTRGLFACMCVPCTAHVFTSMHMRWGGQGLAVRHAVMLLVWCQ
jgi:hypothetical protein